MPLPGVKRNTLGWKDDALREAMPNVLPTRRQGVFHSKRDENSQETKKRGPVEREGKYKNGKGGLDSEQLRLCKTLALVVISTCLQSSLKYIFSPKNHSFSSRRPRNKEYSRNMCDTCGGDIEKDLDSSGRGWPRVFISNVSGISHTLPWLLL